MIQNICILNFIKIYLVIFSVTYGWTDDMNFPWTKNILIKSDNNSERNPPFDEEIVSSTTKSSKPKSSIKARTAKIKVRRCKANARERNRMHNLNSALDTLREYIPIKNKSQKFSKIETLRLARNYITALMETLHYGDDMDNLTFAKILSRQMSQPTTNVIASSFNIESSMLCQKREGFHVESYPADSCPIESCIFEPVDNQVEFFKSAELSGSSDCKIESNRALEFIGLRVLQT